MPEQFDETDEVLARKLAEITPPTDLRARLLAVEAGPVAVIEASPGHWWARGITALAAAVAVALAVLSLWPKSGDPIEAATADISTFLSNGFKVTLATPDVSKVREWLTKKNPDHQVDLPTRLAANPTIGCRELEWRNHRGSLACFSLGGGKEAHLAMFPAGTFADDPGATPKIASAGKWTRAAWTRDGMTYLLFVPAGMDPMTMLAMLDFEIQRAGKIASSNAASNAFGAAKPSSARARISSPV